MAVLARLIDYAGLWERDLYFVVRALTHQLKPEDCFSRDGLKFMQNGQIVRALREIECQTLKETMEDYCELMSYDRKLKNAVSLSIKELLVREGLRINWKMENHRLTNAEISPEQ